MKIGLAQINTVVGDFNGNYQKILHAYRKGVEEGLDLVVFPELALCGYPPRDLLLQTGFLRKNQSLLEELAVQSGETGLLVGYAGTPIKGQRPARNMAALLFKGEIFATQAKALLPTYDVFDEDRYFETADCHSPVVFKGKRVGITICEDIWTDQNHLPRRKYDLDPPAQLIKSGIDVLINLSASPWHLGKNATRLELTRKLAIKANAPLVYCNLVGGNDELVFDGSSMILSSTGEVMAQAKGFEEDWITLDLDKAKPLKNLPVKEDAEKIYQALVLGLRDYLHKCGFQKAILGLSGGIDSAVSACLAVAALGPENVSGFSLPSQYSSQGSLDDARELATHLGISYETLPIEPLFKSVINQLNPVFHGLPVDTTEENVQARLRGVLLMAISNKTGALLITTGNKSELAVGYCTLYGDMCGGLAVLSDVPKTLVYDVARWINRDSEIIPKASITKPPSAELRPDQKDQDSLPPYEILDAVIDAYVVHHQSARDIAELGIDEDLVKKVLLMIDRNEYKRRQAAPGIKVTSRAFGVGRRMPVAQRFQAFD